MTKTPVRWCVATSLLCTAVALAQTPPPSPPPANPAPVATDAPVAAPAPEPGPQIGFRIGGSAGLGAFVPGPQLYLHLFDLHAGIQVNPLFGAYIRFGRTAGVGFSVAASSSGASVGISASGFWLIGANAELGLGDSFFIAAGPQVGIGGWASAKVVATSTSGEVQEVATTGAQPGLDFKIGFGFGGGGSHVKQERRRQVTLALDLSLLYATQVVTATASGSPSGAAVGVSFGDALSIAPTLHLGYEFR